jgi:hypothetical protein
MSATVNEAMAGYKNQIRITDIMELVSGLVMKNNESMGVRR